MEYPEVLRHLECNQPKLVEEAKKTIHELFNTTKETWLLNGLVDYYVNTGSMTCVDVLIGVREPHDKYLFDRLLDSLRNVPNLRLNILTLLGNVVFRQPTWLYKISQHSLLREVIKLLKTETDILVLISALLTLVVLLPMIPAYVGPFLQDIFEVFSRLAAWNTMNPNKLPEEQLIHLQVSLYSLFNRLYGMYPCNFLSYLRNEYSLRENLGVFSHTIKPMLYTVKMHPLLVTASKDAETTTTRWKSMEHHDVIVECAKLLVDHKDDINAACMSSVRPRVESDPHSHRDSTELVGSKQDLGEMWSPSVHCGLSTPPPPTPESSGPTSIPHTPIAQSYVLSTSFPNQEGTSPPEAAIEATPETTPVKDSRHYMTRPPPVNSTVVRALNNLGGTKWSPTSSTPTHSQPSSPMKKEISPFRFPESHDAGPKKESVAQQKISSLFHDRQMIAERSRAAAQQQLASPGEHHNGFRLEENLFHPVESSQEDQEVLEISQQGEQLRIDSGSKLRHCDSVLQDYHPLQEAELDDCHQGSGSPCNSGGLHMPNSQSMLHFKQKVHRWRCYSQCCPDVCPPLVVSSSYQDNYFVPPSAVRRAHSCPEIKKDRPTFTVSESIALDESLELNDTLTEGDVKGLTNGTSTKCPPSLVSSSTQTQLPAECHSYPYEYLFLGVFPPVDQQGTPPPAPTPARRYSPTSTLEKYIEIASKMGDSKKNTTQNLELQVKTVKEQLVLLHLQLKFERHRREVHAERNRRLLGKSRNNRWLEEHNSALRDQMALLERDIDSLHNEVLRLKHEGKQKEVKLQDRVKQWQEKTESYDKQNKELRTKNEELLGEVTQLKQKAMVDTREKQHVEARLFTVCSELKEAAEQASAGEQLKAQIDYLQKELIVMGELQQRYKERLGQLLLQNVRSNVAFQDGYVDEVRTLSQSVESKTSALEAMKNRVTELEALLTRRDILVVEQKRALESVKEECQERLEAVEAKFKCQVATNRKLEEHILELYNKAEASLKRNKRNVSTAQDVLSLAERGGMNSPLSLSLSSSEGMSMSSFVAPESVPARDLQSIVDEPEVKQIPELEEEGDSEP